MALWQTCKRGTQLCSSLAAYSPDEQCRCSSGEYAKSRQKGQANLDDSIAHRRTSYGDRSISSPVRKRLPNLWSLLRSIHGEHRSTAPAVVPKARGSRFAAHSGSKSVEASSSDV